MINRGTYKFIIVAICATMMAITTSTAQELHCTVNINADQVDGSNKQMFQTLQQAISDFINTTRWTSLVFSETERIECTMMMIVNSVTTEGLINASLQVQSRRPVFGTTYSTPLLNLKDDDCTFTYHEFDRIEYQPNQFTTNIASIIAYYCYLIIGTDLDSYSKLGGTICYQVCEEIANTARGSSMDNSEQGGWKATSKKKNRYQIISNLMDDAFSPYRRFFYEYHRLGLDIMNSNVTNGRAIIATELQILKETYRARPNSYMVAVFLDAKNDEIVSLFEKGSDIEKKQVLDILTAVDPTRLTTVYEKIKL